MQVILYPPSKGSKTAPKVYENAHCVMVHEVGSSVLYFEHEVNGKCECIFSTLPFTLVCSDTEASSVRFEYAGRGRE